MKKPKSIIITGASSGIGTALALHYAAQGVVLGLSGRNQERLDDITKLCRQKGADVVSHVIDVVDKDAMNDWISSFADAQDLDLIIANAGISGGTGGQVDGQAYGEPADQVRKIFDINVHGVFNTIHPAICRMQAQETGGQIAIVSSLAGFRGWPSCPAYSASKGAVRFYGEALRGVLSKTKIKVNVICPGFVTSRITDQNDFPMPFKMEANKAAQIIATGLAKNKGRIAFPLPTHFVSWFMSVLPDFLAQKILDKAPAKKKL